MYSNGTLPRLSLRVPFLLTLREFSWCSIEYGLVCLKVQALHHIVTTKPNIKYVANSNYR